MGFAIRNKERYSKSWSDHIIDEWLIAYKHGNMRLTIAGDYDNLNFIIIPSSKLNQVAIVLASLKTELMNY